jgi:hypothetical protein
LQKSPRLSLKPTRRPANYSHESTASQINPSPFSSLQLRGPRRPGRPERGRTRWHGLRRPTPVTPSQTETSTSTSKQPATEQASKPALYCSSELWPRAAADMAAAVLTPVALG